MKNNNNNRYSCSCGPAILLAILLVCLSICSRINKLEDKTDNLPSKTTKTEIQAIQNDSTRLSIPAQW